MHEAQGTSCMVNLKQKAYTKKSSHSEHHRIATSTDP